MKKFLARALALLCLTLVLMPLVLAGSSELFMGGGSVYAEGSVKKGTVTVTKNVLESYPGQARFDSFTVTATIIPPDGETLPDGLPGVKINDTTYRLTMTAGQSYDFTDLPIGTRFSVVEDPEDFSFTIAYMADGKSGNTLIVDRNQDVDGVQYLTIKNDFRKSPCSTGTIKVTKVVEGEGAVSPQGYNFLITFKTPDGAPIPGIADDDPSVDGVQHGFSIHYVEGSIWNYKTFSGIPVGTLVTLRETSTGSYTTTITLNGQPYDSGEIIGNCELTFICTNTYGGTTSPSPSTSGDITSPSPSTSGGITSPSPSTSGDITSPSPSSSGDDTSPSPSEEIELSPDPSIPLDDLPTPSGSGTTGTETDPGGQTSNPGTDEDLPYTGGVSIALVCGAVGLGLVTTGLLLGKKTRV